MLLDPASPQSTELGTLISDALKYCQLEEHHTLIAGLLPLGTNILVSRIRLALLQQFAQAPMSPYSFSLWWKDNTPVEIQGKTLSNDYRPAIQGLLCANPTKLPPGKRRGAVALFYQSVETAQRGEKIEVVMIELAEGLKALGLTSKERVKDALKIPFTANHLLNKTSKPSTQQQHKQLDHCDRPEDDGQGGEDREDDEEEVEEAGEDGEEVRGELVVGKKMAVVSNRARYEVKKRRNPFAARPKKRQRKRSQEEIGRDQEVSEVEANITDWVTKVAQSHREYCGY